MSNELPSFKEAMGMFSSAAEPHQVFEIAPTGELTCHGYTVNEVIGLLEAYRAHMKSLISDMQVAQTASDAVRYTPQGPEDIMGG